MDLAGIDRLMRYFSGIIAFMCIKFSFSYNLTLLFNIRSSLSVPLMLKKADSVTFSLNLSWLELYLRNFNFGKILTTFSYVLQHNYLLPGYFYLFFATLWNLLLKPIL